eukprot:m.97921 g.97921  ORF g.97921 m.97921 type:complete len:294 (+) comp18549_c0_seq3:103-984(+)
MEHFIRFNIDAIAGVGAGMVCKVVEYPFDTVKVMHQTRQPHEPRISSMGHVMRVYQRNGVRHGLYMGMLSPLLGSMAENAVLLASYNLTKNQFISFFPSTKKEPWVPALSGAVAGIATGYVLTPVELVKCKLQNQNNLTVKEFRGPFDVVRKTIASRGVAGLFEGISATLLREIPGNAAWFFTYETARRWFAGERHLDELKPYETMVSGGLAGMAYWTAFYPADTVKTAMQVSSGDRGFVAIFRHILREEGFTALYKGWGITAARASVSNALLFYAYSTVEKLLRKTFLTESD